MKNSYDILILGGGAAGFFTAINASVAQPKATVCILERGKDVLQKVRISGGGRCNVTHAQWEPKELTGNYPRGHRELLGPFHSFMSGDTVGWFADRGVELKIEEDGRMFPVTDSSQTIIDTFMNESRGQGHDLRTSQTVQSIEKEDNLFVVRTQDQIYQARYVVVTTGSNPKVWKLLESLDHEMVGAVPSLFTFVIKDPLITQLPGVSTAASVSIADHKLEASGPLLITHKGLSGPAVLKISAWGARELAACQYTFDIAVNWLDDREHEDVLNHLKSIRSSNPKQNLRNLQMDLPKRLQEQLIQRSGLQTTDRIADMSNVQLDNLATTLTACRFRVSGKNTFKEEFTTAGGVALKQVNFKTFESRVMPNLFLAGEVLDIDAVTGGFNFQNAWTGGYLIAQELGKRLAAG